jgi:hypothetical protein
VDWLHLGNLHRVDIVVTFCYVKAGRTSSADRHRSSTLLRLFLRGYYMCTVASLVGRLHPPRGVSEHNPAVQVNECSTPLALVLVQFQRVGKNDVSNSLLSRDVFKRCVQFSVVVGELSVSSNKFRNVVFYGAPFCFKRTRAPLS